MPFMKPFVFALLFGFLWAPGSGVVSSQTLQRRPPHPAAPVERVKPVAQPHPVVPAGTALQVEIPRHYPMKAGEALDGELVFPIYLDGKLAIPAGTHVRGRVTALLPDSKTRLWSRFDGDFTPFHIAQIEFDELILAGQPLQFSSKGATTGAPVLRLSATGSTARHAFLVREWDNAKQQLHDRIAYFTTPGFGDRAKLLLYHQLPYHPERIPAHTAWTFELAAPLPLPEFSPAPQPVPSVVPGRPEIWSVRALLTAEVTSANARRGDPVHAVVVEPVFDKDRQLAVPQGSILLGKVTTAKHARSLGRNGKLRFNFQQILFPENAGTQAASRDVESSLGGVTTQSNHSLNMDTEGTVTSKNESSALAPLLLTFLVGRALDSDGSLVAGTTVASNGFGLAGRVAGIAAGSRDFAAALGSYAAALSFTRNYLRPGRDVDFPKDTRIEIETSPLRSPVLKPTAP